MNRIMHYAFQTTGKIPENNDPKPMSRRDLQDAKAEVLEASKRKDSPSKCDHFGKGISIKVVLDSVRCAQNSYVTFSKIVATLQERFRTYWKSEMALQTCFLLFDLNIYQILERYRACVGIKATHEIYFYP